MAIPALLAGAGAAHAQAYQCRIPQGPVAVPQVSPDGPARRMDVTGYTLALSWSPEYCRGREERATDAVQCSGRNGRFGLILHGLWPEGPNASWPQWCPTKRAPSPELVRRNMCMTPSARLLAEEWAKHGSCMTASPETYFKVARILWESHRLPDLDRLSRRKGLTAGMIREALVAANPWWETDEIGVDLNPRGWLEEIRFCYGTDFRPKRCNRSQAGAGASVEAKIWRGL